MNASTAHPDEIAQFARLADKWWDADGEFRPLHQLNPARIGYICNRLCAHFDRDPKSMMPLQGLSLVDVGCGGAQHRAHRIACHHKLQTEGRVVGTVAARRGGAIVVEGDRGGRAVA